MKQKKIIIPIPLQDFDPTEAAVPWKILTHAGYEVLFATIDGCRGYADPLMLTGQGLDPWGWVPILKNLPVLGLLLRADRNGRSAYLEMEQDLNFLNPLKFADLQESEFDGLIIPGGHASGMKAYLENKTLQNFISGFFNNLDDSANHKPVGAICHGVLLVARSVSSTTHKSVLYGKKTTALPWKMEKSAWDITKYYGRFWDANYYRTYHENKEEPSGHWSVEKEIKRHLKDEDDFINVSEESEHFFLKSSGLFRDNIKQSRPAWIVEDGNYLSARWPGDAHTFARSFTLMMDSYSS